VAVAPAAHISATPVGLKPLAPEAVLHSTAAATQISAQVLGVQVEKTLVEAAEVREAIL
jgi:hypothetical protein